MSSTVLPYSVYVHLPWCVRKCPYCDFNSHAGTPEETLYLQALERDLEFELEQRTRWASPRSVFIGGGTPSLFSPEAIESILSLLDRRLGLPAGTEITMEANPGTVDEARFAGYRSAGVNRLSLGVQSFDNEMLQKLGRIHDGAASARAIIRARRAGFDNLNIDLMHGLPGQSLAQAMADLDQALALEPSHLSWYQLTIEENTAFAQSPPRLPDDDACGEIEERGFRRLRQAGLRRYEISAFAQPGRRSQHNLNYWRFGDYLGLGAGAHGKLTGPAGIERRARLRSPQKYMAGAGSAAAIARQHQPSPQQLVSEFALNALRVDGAFSRQRFEQRTGLKFADLRAACEEAVSLGLARQTENLLQPTALGRRHLNRLLECFAEIRAFQ